MPRTLAVTCLAIGAVLTGNAWAAMCYKVYDARSQLVYRSAVPPVDLSGNAAEQIRSRWPNGYLVSMESPLCGPLDDDLVRSPSVPTTTNAKDNPRVTEYSPSPSALIVAPAFGIGAGATGSDYGLYPYTSSSSGTGYSGYSGTAGTDVHVKGYTRKDGTYVRPHTRAAPGRGRGR